MKILFSLLTMLPIKVPSYVGFNTLWTFRHFSNIFFEQLNLHWVLKLKFLTKCFETIAGREMRTSNRETMVWPNSETSNAIDST